MEPPPEGEDVRDYMEARTFRQVVEDEAANESSEYVLEWAHAMVGALMEQEVLGAWVKTTTEMSCRSRK